MHLILNHVTQLQEVSHTNCSWLVELLTCLTIIEVSRTEARQTSLICPFRKVFQLSTVKDRSSELNTQLLTCSTEDTLKDLTKVHSRRHTQWVQYHINRTTVCHEWHILKTNYLRNDTLITVTTSKLITYLNLTLLSDVNLSHLKNS